MRNALSWLLSILLHIAVALFLLHSVQLEPLFLEKILEVDLTQVEEPEPITPMPEPEPVPMEQPVAEAAEELPAAAPLPMDKTVVLDDAPPLPPEPEPLAEAEPEPEAGPEPEATSDPTDMSTEGWSRENIFGANTVYWTSSRLSPCQDTVLSLTIARSVRRSTHDATASARSGSSVRRGAFDNRA